tara:strand:- start:450 stop:635 length:186 start_codon:yes stop_codon:yes gene_type:complete
MLIWKIILWITVVALGLSPFAIPVFIGKITKNSFVGFVLFFGYMALVLFIIKKIIPIIHGY